MSEYEEKGFTLDKAIHLAANDDLPYLQKTQTRVRSISNRFLQVTVGSSSIVDIGISENVQEQTRYESDGHYQN